MPQSQDITDGIDGQIWLLLQKAIDTNSVDNIKPFMSFFRSIIRKSIQTGKIKYFQQYIYFPSRIYSDIASRYSGSSTYSATSDNLAAALPLHLKEIIWFGIGMKVKEAKSFSEKELLNKYYYEAFKSFNDLFYKISRQKDWALFKKSLEYFMELPVDVFTIDIRKRMHFEELKKNNVDGKYDAEIKELKFEREIYGKFGEYKRRTLSALRYWLFFLYRHDMIKAEQIVEILGELDEKRSSPDVEVADLLFFRTQDLNAYMGWEGWDYIPRPDGKVYYPPMASDWMTEGFLLDRVMKNNTRFETSLVPEDLHRSINYLPLALSDDIDNIIKEFEVWNKVLSISNIDELRRRFNTLRVSVARAERNVIGAKERAIAKASLSEAKITLFREKAAEEWRASAKIRRLFQYFKNLNDVTEQDIELKRIGIFTLMEKGKMAFIEDEYFEHIGGMGRIGSEVGKYEDTLFFDVAIRSDIPKRKGTKIVELMESVIQELRTTGVTASIIIVSREHLYNQNEFRDSKQFSSGIPQQLTEFGLGRYFVGTFNSIPVLALLNDLLAGTFIITDFAGSFSMKYKTNPTWEDSEFAVSVKELPEKQVEMIYQKDPMKWKVTDSEDELTEEEAKVLIKTSVLVDVNTILNFYVVDPSKSRIGYVVSDTE